MLGSCQGLNKFRKKIWKKLQNSLKLTLWEIYPTSVNEEPYIASNTSIKGKCTVTPPSSTQETPQSNLLLNCSITFIQKTVLLNQSKNNQSFKFNKKLKLFPSRKKKSGKETTKAAQRNLLRTRKNTFQNLLLNRQVRKKKRNQLSKTLEKRRKNRLKTISRDRSNIMLNKTVKAY